MRRSFKYILIIIVVLFTLLLTACSSPGSRARDRFLKNHPKLSNSDIADIYEEYNEERTICNVHIIVGYGLDIHKSGAEEIIYKYEKLSGTWTLMNGGDDGGDIDSNDFQSDDSENDRQQMLADLKDKMLSTMTPAPQTPHASPSPSTLPSYTEDSGVSDPKLNQYLIDNDIALYDHKSYAIMDDMYAVYTKDMQLIVIHAGSGEIMDAITITEQEATGNFVKIETSYDAFFNECVALTWWWEGNSWQTLYRMNDSGKLEKSE